MPGEKAAADAAAHNDRIKNIYRKYREFMIQIRITILTQLSDTLLQRLI